MIFDRPIELVLMLILLLAGNIFAFTKITTHPTDFLNLYPKLNPNSLTVLKIIQILNIITIIGIWYFQKWGVWAALTLALTVIILDIYFEFIYHVFVVIITVGLTMWFIIMNWQLFY